ncbi:HTTM domain-containing protein [Natrarchaeobius chitinivorans]|uniref:HTTM domain-containing protein n=1 Tax=Natrarchaeobius chitinivorans TaxID=1679083 RepID=A0A3N6LNS4_NATCH|nr:HTTM domain-containing protein [Natrarchaeobius chitinivorans]RQG91048.1 HTTM domain-containing protein [Natrarchaeobius chitinivorans]
MATGRWERLAGTASGAKRYVRGCVRIDTRTLAVFRVFLAVLILADLALRSRNFTAFYTKDGLVPPDLARETAPIDVGSVYFLSPDPAVTAGLFVVHGLVAVGLLVGYRTRIATALSFVFVVLLDLRNPLVLSYADVLFAWLLLWAIFLPLGARWSVDAVHADRPPRTAVATVASGLILLQMITMYVVNGVHKSGSELWQSGEAAVLVLGLDDMTFLLGDLVRSVPTALQFGGLAWYYMLLFSWLLVLARGRLRTALVGAFVTAHLSFALTVRIGAFAYVALAGVVLFLQASFWEDLSSLGRRLESRIARLEGVRPRIDRVRSGLESCQSRLEEVAIAVPRLEVDAGLGERVPANPYRAVVPLVAVVFAGIVLVSVLSAGGVVDTDASSVDAVDGGVDAFVDHQTEWRIFAPEPRTTDRYYVFPATTADGDRIDAYNDRELRFERPSDQLQTQYGTYRERFYMNSVATPDHPDVPVRLAESICADRDDGGDAVTHLEMYLIEEDVTLETIDDPANRTREATLLYRHRCGDAEPIDVAQPPF